MILYVKEKLWFDGVKAFSDEPEYSEHDLVVEYKGVSYTEDGLTAIAGRLICHLFYITLLSLPPFHGRPLKCQVQLRCRLPPGPPLMDLLMRLDRGGTQVYFRGNQAKYSSATLCTQAVLKRCREGGPFRKTIDIEVVSPESVIDIKIRPPSTQPESISNCPYILHKLITHQGLDRVFGWKDHTLRGGAREEGGSPGCQSVLEDELAALGLTLQKIGKC